MGADPEDKSIKKKRQKRKSLNDLAPNVRAQFNYEVRQAVQAYSVQQKKQKASGRKGDVGNRIIYAQQMAREFRAVIHLLSEAGELRGALAELMDEGTLLHFGIIPDEGPDNLVEALLNELKRFRSEAKDRIEGLIIALERFQLASEEALTTVPDDPGGSVRDEALATLVFVLANVWSMYLGRPTNNRTAVAKGEPGSPFDVFVFDVIVKLLPEHRPSEVANLIWRATQAHNPKSKGFVEFWETSDEFWQPPNKDTPTS